MKYKILIMAIFYMGLYGLEPVNIIENSSFEVEQEPWYFYSQKKFVPEDYDGEHNKTDDNSYEGEYSGSLDVREVPEVNGNSDTWISLYYVMPLKKAYRFGDMDRMEFAMYVEYRNGDYEMTSFFEEQLLYYYGDIVKEKGKPEFLYEIYHCKKGLFLVPDYGAVEEIPSEGEWVWYERDLKKDMEEQGISADTLINYVRLRDFGIFYYDATMATYYWHGQKVYWDALRLYAWADKDIGIVRYRGDTLSYGQGEIEPSVVIWCNGRERLEDIPVILNVKGPDGEEIYEDTVMVERLNSDDSVKVNFNEFMPYMDGYYDLYFMTGNYAGIIIEDESYEDDTLRVRIEVKGTGIGERGSIKGSVVRVVGGVLEVNMKSEGEIYDVIGRFVQKLDRGENRVRLNRGIYYIVPKDKSRRKIKVLVP